MKSLISANLAAIAYYARRSRGAFCNPRNDNARLQPGAEGFATQTTNMANASVPGKKCNLGETLQKVVRVATNPLHGIAKP